MVAITGDDAVLADRHRALQTDRHRFLADVEVAEAADQPEPVKLPRPLLEAPDEQHLAIELHHLVLRRLVSLRPPRALDLGFLLGCWNSRFLRGSRHGDLSTD